MSGFVHLERERHDEIRARAMNRDTETALIRRVLESRGMNFWESFPYGVTG